MIFKKFKNIVTALLITLLLMPSKTTYANENEQVDSTILKLNQKDIKMQADVFDYSQLTLRSHFPMDGEVQIYVMGKYMGKIYCYSDVANLYLPLMDIVPNVSLKKNEKIITIQKNGYIISHELFSNILVVNGVNTYFNNHSKVIDEKIYVPIYMLAEVLQCRFKVSNIWLEEGSNAIIEFTYNESYKIPKKNNNIKINNLVTMPTYTDVMVLDQYNNPIPNVYIGYMNAFIDNADGSNPKRKAGYSLAITEFGPYSYGKTDYRGLVKAQASRIAVDNPAFQYGKTNSFIHYLLLYKENSFRLDTYLEYTPGDEGYKIYVYLME